MSEYVVVDKEQLEADLTTVADSIRAKSGTTEDLAFPLGMKEVVESIDTSKEEQAKTIEITENGTTEVIPDEGKVLSKVTVNTNVESGGGSGEEFVGIKLSGFTGVYNLPTIADVRSYQKIIDNATSDSGLVISAYMFANNSKNTNGGLYVNLEEVYIPNGLKNLNFTFLHCVKLKNIYGDLSEVLSTNAAFQNCTSLTELPYMPNLDYIGNFSFENTGISQAKLYKKPSTMTNNVFRNSTNLKDIYVPWSEGEVANAPWGATNATIHYNTVYDENHNPIV